jgi:AraC-like DNA-binding protein/mannose-6-phosphate isomerase-like protein (cupin superfamily)
MNRERITPELILLNGGIARHDADWNWENVSSPFARFYLVLEGEAKVYLKGKEYELRPGHIYLIPPFVFHRCECLGRFVHYYFHVYEKPSARTRLLEEYNFPFELDAGGMDSTIFSRLLGINPGRELSQSDPSTYDNPHTLMQTLFEEMDDSYYTHVETHGLLCQLLSRFLKYAVSKIEFSDTRISKALGYIRKNGDKVISIDELAEVCCLSNRHFMRLFKKELDDSPVEYINKRKMEKAQLLLITTDIPVKEIAHSLSFHNISYFHRLFKSTVGVTPGDYRNM